MTTSDVIALTVAAVLILVCCYLFLSIVIRGRLETSGYMIDWKTSPTGMISTLVSLLVCPVLIVWGFATQWNIDNDVIIEPYKAYVDFQPGHRPNFRYEGSGIHRDLFITKDDVGIFHFLFSTMSLPDGIVWELDGVNDLPEYRTFDFSGSLSYSNGNCCLTGELQSREPGHLLVLGADKEVSLHPGMNHIEITWNYSEKNCDEERKEQKGDLIDSDKSSSPDSNPDR